MSSESILLSPFPDVERRIWRENLIQEVISQVRFPRLLLIDRDLPVEFQAAVYADYPNLEEKDIVNFELQAGSSTGTTPIIQNRGKEYHFHSRDRIWTVSLTSSFVAIKTTSYNSWDQFLDKLRDVLEKFVNIYRPATVARIGLRYVNVITADRAAKSALTWSAILKPAFDPLYSSLEEGSERIVDRKSSFQYRLSEDQSTFVQVRHGFMQTGENSAAGYVIDSDFYEAKEQDTNVEGIAARLSEFNRSARNLLYWALDDCLISTLD